MSKPIPAEILFEANPDLGIEIKFAADDQLCRVETKAKAVLALLRLRQERREQHEDEREQSRV